MNIYCWTPDFHPLNLFLSLKMTKVFHSCLVKKLRSHPWSPSSYGSQYSITHLYLWNISWFKLLYTIIFTTAIVKTIISHQDYCNSLMTRLSVSSLFLLSILTTGTLEKLDHFSFQVLRKLPNSLTVRAQVLKMIQKAL